MQIRVAAVGRKMPGWVTTAWTEYTRRMPRSVSVSLSEISLQKRVKNADIPRLVQQESDALLAALPGRCRIVALDVNGKAWSTMQLADRLRQWMGAGSDVGLLIGGPDGLSESCLETADELWSLGPLTLPHPLVRVLLAEQLYRAWSITCGHPYHRQ
jgi:23S rRNA (pseudouridine1915-N3)-methyltransferase